MSPSGVAVLIPVLGRPERVEETLWSLGRGRRTATLRPVYLASPNDHAQMAAVLNARKDADHGLSVRLLVVPWDPGAGDYARKINLGIERTDEPWVFVGADDLCYCPGWADRALRAASAQGARVVGVNDLIPRSREHATHFLVARSYVEECGTIDEPGRLLHEGYDHQYIDLELIETARARREYVYAGDAHVEHLHPFVQKSRMDATYLKGQRAHLADKRLFESRRPLWKNTTARRERT